MSTNNNSTETWKIVAWIVFALFMVGGCLSTTGGSSSTKATTNSGGVGSSDYGSASCRSAGKQEFTSFNSPEWKDYVSRCAPPGVK